jgi:microcystin-dependent protein
MAVFNEPNQWEHPLGNNADTSTLPDDAAATAGIASLTKLFQIINATPLEAGGIAPDREDVNALFKYLGDQIFYTQNGGVPSYNADYDYVAGRVVLYNDNIYKCIQANGVSSTVVTPDSDTAYWLRLDSNGAIGEIKYFAFNTPPESYLACNGASVSRTTYANLFAVIGTTFGSGDGSTTFNIPDLRDRYIIGANTNALGTQIAEQLPNITGDVAAQNTGGSIMAVGAGDPQHGALYCSDFNNENITHYSGRGQANTLNFNASRSNSIYTDKGHVYPLSLALLPCIKY